MRKDIFGAVEDRRTYYSIGSEAPASDERIMEIIRHAVKHAPTAFNSQSARIAVLLGKDHERLWNIASEILKGIVPPENFAATEKKLLSFRNGYGTVLYFEDQDTVKGLEEKYPLYADNFPVWSLESSGMLQYIVWALLEAEGFGVSLQHYNPLIDRKVAETWKIPASWKLLGEMPFGNPTAAPVEKTFLPLDGRVKVFK